MLNAVVGLHLYQPPSQYPEVVERIAAESHRPLLHTILDEPKAYLCLDIAACAIELLQVYAPDVIWLIEECLRQRKLYLVNTAAFHPILPLMHASEVERQLSLNIAAYEQCFKPFTVPTGCFLPEMAYASHVIPPLRRSWTRWTIADDDPYEACYGHKPPFDWIAADEGMPIFLRSNLWSNRLSRFDQPENHSYTNGAVFVRALLDGVRAWQGNDAEGYVVIWLDFETFGHHSKKDLPNLINTFFPPLFNAQNDTFRLTDPNALVKRFPTRAVKMPSGSWSTTKDHWRTGNYFPLWADKNVPYHVAWWKLIKIATDIVQRHPSDPFIRRQGDKMVYSCQPWQYMQGNKHLARLGLRYFENVLAAGRANEKTEGRRLLDTLYDLTRE